MSIFRNRGDDTLAPRQDYLADESPIEAAIGDLNGDGNADLVVATQTLNQTSVLYNQCQ